jgi:hypothetical protein
MHHSNKVRNFQKSITVIALICAACYSSPDGSLTGVTTSHFIIYGKVLRPSGMPVAGADVLISHRPNGCTGASIEATTKTTDVTGSYREDFTIASAPLGCVTVRASISGSLPDSVSLSSPHFVTYPKSDSANVNLVIK